MEQLRMFIRSYAQQLRELDKLRVLLLSNASEEELRCTIRQQLQQNVDGPAIAIASLKEFLIANGSFHTDRELQQMIDNRLISNRDAVELESFVAFARGGQEFAPKSTHGEVRRMYRRLYLYQLLSESVRCEARMAETREKVRYEMEPKELFSCIKKRYERQADAASIAEACRVNADDVRLVLLDVGCDRIDLEGFCQLLGEQCSISDETTSTQANRRLLVPRTPNNFQAEVELKSLREYLRQLVVLTDRLERRKEDVINEFRCLSSSSMFLLFTSSLKQTVNIRKFKERLRSLGLQIDGRSAELFYRRYCSQDGFTLVGAKEFITPVDDSFQKILARRELQAPTHRSLEGLIDLIREGIELEGILASRKFKECGYADLYNRVDQNRDTYLCQSDLLTMLKGSITNLTGKQLANLLHRFTRGRSIRRMTFSDFVGQLQQ